MVCSLALAAVGSAESPVPRPVKLAGHVTVTVDLSDGTCQFQEWGEATGLGCYTNEGSGTDYGAVGSGVATGANGDQVFWRMPGSEWHTEITGGTGRFAGITGGFNQVWQSDPEINLLDANTMVVTYTYTGIGTVIY